MKLKLDFCSGRTLSIHPFIHQRDNQPCTYFLLFLGCFLYSSHAVIVSTRLCPAWSRRLIPGCWRLAGSRREFTPSRWLWPTRAARKAPMTSPSPCWRRNTRRKVSAVLRKWRQSVAVFTSKWGCLEVMDERGTHMQQRTFVLVIAHFHLVLYKYPFYLLYL